MHQPQVSCGQDLLWGPEQDLPLMYHQSKTNAMKPYLFFDALFFVMEVA